MQTLAFFLGTTRITYCSAKPHKQKLAQQKSFHCVCLYDIQMTREIVVHEFVASFLR